ncbi:MAG TPA: transcription-repair coupling factor, partial [Xanthomonadaceae bacterium]|nr:transcription-repair coupling factor [Xanthomonadaceae bacterium]
MTHPALPAAPLPARGQQRADWRLPVNPTAAALAIVERARAHAGLVLAVARDTAAALRLEADLKSLARGLPVLHFPDWETLPYDLFSPHPDIISERVAALYRLPALKRGVLVVPVSTLLQRLAPPEWIAGNVLDLKRGQKLDLDAEKRRLQAAGYRHVPQVNDPGDFSVRGALLDLFPTGAEEPYRIELFDDTVDSLRSFDPETQRSMHAIDAIELLPAREFPLDEASCKRAREAMLDRFDVNPRRCPLVQDLKEGVAPAGIEYYLPFFFERTASLFEHVPANAL